mgnify:CR=1 FL=1
MLFRSITVERLKTFVLIGHSNADGWASSDLLWTSPYAPYLAPGSTSASTDGSYWKGVYVATSAQPFPAANHDPVASSVDDVAWLEMTVNNPDSPAASHPHPSPYNFPNNQGACYPRWMYNAANIFPSGGGTGTKCGVEIPLSWFWHHHWNEQVGIVKMAFSSTYMMRADVSGSAASTLAATWLDLYGWGGDTPANGHQDAVNPSPFGYYGYWTPADQFDWAPGTDRLYGLLIDKMTGAQSALAPNTKMDVQLLVIWMGDNESLGQIGRAHV